MKLAHTHAQTLWKHNASSHYVAGAKHSNASNNS